MPMLIKRLSPILLLLFALPAQAQLRGHGGPVRALAIAPDGTQAVSGVSIHPRSAGRSISIPLSRYLRLHDGAVNAVAYLRDGRVVTAGADARIAIWTPDSNSPTGFSMATPRQSQVSRYRPTMRCLHQRRGTAPSACGR